MMTVSTIIPRWIVRSDLFSSLLLGRGRWHEFFAIMHYTIHLTTPLLSIEKHLPLPLTHSTTVSNVQKTYYSNVWNNSSTVFHHSWQSYDQRVFNNSMQRFNSILQQLQDSNVQISTENRNILRSAYLRQPAEEHHNHFIINVNIDTMHAADRDEVERVAEAIADILDKECRHEIW